MVSLESQMDRPDHAHLAWATVEPMALPDLCWREAAEVPELDPAAWRVDHLCRLMRYSDFGDATSAFGWTIFPIEVECATPPTVHEAREIVAVNHFSLRA